MKKAKKAATRDMMNDRNVPTRTSGQAMMLVTRVLVAAR